MNAQRLLTIDALRGIGASAVMAYHLSANLKDYDWAPGWLDTVLGYGFLGVPLFFVISGFVIAQSTLNANVSGRFLGKFALKRSIRLDPTYWCALALALVLLYVKGAAFPEHAEQTPTLQDVLLHVFYLQDLAQAPAISVVFWTLCLEIQFYLFFIGSRLLIRRNLHWLLLAVSAVSLLQYHGHITGIPGLFVQFWFLFHLGVVTCWYLNGKTSTFWPLMILVGLFVALDAKPFAIAGFVSATFITVTGLAGQLTTLLANRPLLYLGTISYSLYLVHAELGWVTISLLKHFTEGHSAVLGLVFFVAGVAVSIAAAHVLWLLVERPSNELAKRVGRPRKQEAPMPQALHSP